MKELIERLEKATGPDRAIDLDIARMLGVTVMRQNDDDDGAHEDTYWQYTKKVDDALTLVPEGWAWFAQWIGEPFSEGHARLWIPSQRTQGLRVENHDVDAATPAIALCIAALKARVSALTSPER